MKKLFLIIVVLVVQNTSGQRTNSVNLGQTTLDELKMSNYPKDSSANALVLHEEIFTYYNPTKKNSYIKYFYTRIKIFSKSAYNLATVEIPTYQANNIENIEAVTYNLSENGQIKKTQLKEKDIQKSKYSKHIKQTSFALPNVREGSVIEYKYKIKTSGYGIYDWEIQSSIPKAKAVYVANVPVDLRSRLIGYIQPDFKKISVKSECFSGNLCTNAKYEFIDVPAFKEEEYLTSKRNYLARISYERQYYSRFVEKGENREWRTLDRFYRKYYEEELDYRSFFKQNIPASILSEPDDLLRAKATFYFIQNHYTLGNQEDKNIDKAFKSKVGSSFTINLSLYNALKASKIKDVKLMILSTRENGFVTDIHPTNEDFNYILVRVIINGEKYLLDATDKHAYFGLIPFKTLNKRGRVLDYVNNSYWEAIEPEKNNSLRVRMKISLNDDGNFKGHKTVTNTGYYGVKKKSDINFLTKEKYIEKIESKNPELEIINYELHGLASNEKTLKENFDFLVEGNYAINMQSLLLSRRKNPFTLEERKYPVDFGYRMNNTYAINIKIPEGYTLKKLPDDSVLSLRDNTATYIFKSSVEKNQATIFIKLQINKETFTSDEYQDLKKFYSTIINTENSVLEFIKE